MLIQTSISTLNKKIKFSCENHDKKEDNNFVQNNHRRLNQYRFKVLFIQTFYQTQAFNLSRSDFFNSIFH